MLVLERVTKVYNQGRVNEFTALHDVSLTIGLNAVTAFKGPSGSGKTTLLTLIGCMARPSAGRIFVTGREVTSLPERFLAEVRRKTFGFVFQSTNLIRGLTVLENVMVPAYPLGEPAAAIRERAMGLLRRFHIEDKAERRAETLSGGERQRAAIARALVNGPTVLVADEPTAHLDSVLTSEFLAIVRTLRDDGVTVLLSSHDPAVVEADVVDRVVAVRDGRVAEQEPAACSCPPRADTDAGPA